MGEGALALVSSHTICGQVGPLWMPETFLGWLIEGWPLEVPVWGAPESRYSAWCQDQERHLTGELVGLEYQAPGRTN